MAKNPWVLPDGFDADTRKAVKALLDALKKSGAKIPQDAYTQLRLGNIEAFMAYVDWEKISAGFGNLEQILTTAAQRNGRSTYTLGGVDAQLLFDLIDERAVIYARERVGKLIVEITEQMREVVRETIAQAQSGQMTYQSAAIRLQSTIPLTSRDAGAVDKFIEKKFSKFMKDGLSEARARIKAQDMGAKYAAKLLESRTRTIARTEIIDASMSGRYIGWEAGVTAGQISADSVKEWIAEPDACPICSELDGMIITWNDEWVFPEGVTAGSTNRMPPAHPNCRCSVVILPPDYADNIFTPQSGGEMPEQALGIRSELKTIGNLYGLDETTALDELNKIYESQKFAGMNASVTKVLTKAGEVAVQGQFTNPASGDLVGRFQRIFNRYSDGSLSVIHQLLEIEPSYRGRGISTAFGNFSEKWYRNSGVDRIKVLASLEDGGYTWAKAGYNWVEKPWSLIMQLRNKYAELSYTPHKESALQIEALWNLMRETDVTDSNFPLPVEIANLEGPEMGNKSFGRWLLTGSEWEGEKKL